MPDGGGDAGVVARLEYRFQAAALRRARGGRDAGVIEFSLD